MYESNKISTSVTIESPYAGDVDRNNTYLNLCILDCLLRGETPYASHRMLPGALDDNVPEERKLGISAGLAMSKITDKRAFYADLGYSTGMSAAKAYYESEGMSFEERALGPFAIGEMYKELRKRSTIGVIKITRIDILRATGAPDKLFLNTTLPEGCSPFLGFAKAQIDVARGKGTMYCERHFAGIPYRIIEASAPDIVYSEFTRIGVTVDKSEATEEGTSAATKPLRYIDEEKGKK